eukprot:TRINITY_DN30170_c0_g1_i1.p1 TRINITY_DN30170_c0_g1~~TRINITY_DN30170_c0_g1_i1.p1  ORF type:complete len:331 (-),score=46.98 TRINITY_DN30170_c0_g1_i1:2-994(-)
MQVRMKSFPSKQCRMCQDIKYSQRYLRSRVNLTLEIRRKYCVVSQAKAVKEKSRNRSPNQCVSKLQGDKKPENQKIPEVQASVPEESDKDASEEKLEQDTVRKETVRKEKPGWAQHFQVYQEPKMKPQKKVGFFSKKSFKDLQVPEQLIGGLKQMGIERPSHIQQLAIDLLESGKRQIIVADHAGSGKTLAYLLPIVKLLKAEEEALGKENCLLPNKPRAVIVCPTTELAAQVMRVARALSKWMPFCSVAATGGHKRRSQIEILKSGVDMVVCTPGRLLELVESGHVDLTFCRAVVVDEVDVLWRDEEQFRTKILAIKDAVQMSSSFTDS